MVRPLSRGAARRRAGGYRVNASSPLAVAVLPLLELAVPHPVSARTPAPAPAAITARREIVRLFTGGEVVRGGHLRLGVRRPEDQRDLALAGQCDRRRVSG